ncbi:hypothetical protein L486_04018 [Kwoniella mangroviensis CBS 10435]|uniref:DNA replication regulator SLD2 n=1 Tax=Kwoniella mangroviensis CBS 10435 TaxID=1331196 RepID=A0A1B9IR37_9TREE|nr:hypothetical protein L486_04018 [Kwoniella mangroviensis CBS 10435]
MDLPTVKAAVKSWEKSFRSREGRDPTKEDIKRDPGDIASQYALYRKLTKASSSSSSQSLRPPPSSSTAAPSSSSSSQYRSTPRNIPSSEYPTTPTPPSRRVSGSLFSSASASHSQAGPSRSNNISLGVGPQDDNLDNKSLKRKASKSNISSSPPPTSTSSLTSRTLFSTHKKYKAYTGPIHDPNPINPFTTTTTPTKSSPFGPGPGVNVNGLQREKSFSSPFIHASSPKKLKEVLEANSLKKVKERTNVGNEITPRTRARKRLKGEEVEDTPLKQKVPRRKRGQGQARTSEEPLEPLEEEEEEAQGNFLKPGNRSIFDDEDEDEDELGPSPIKVNDKQKGKGFTSLFGEVEGEVGDDEDEEEEEEISRTINQQISVSARLNGNDASASNKSKAGLDTGKSKNIKKAKRKSNGNSNGNGIMNFFNRISTGKSTLPIKPQNPKEDELSKHTSPIPISEEVPSIQIQSPPLLEPTPSADEISLMDDISPIMEEAMPDDEPGLASDYTPSASQRRRGRVLNLSDDEIDQFDPEGGYVKREIRIVPTRREVKRRNSSSDLSGEEDDDEQQDATGLNANEQDGEEQPQEEGKEQVFISPSNTKSLSIPMLNLLSIHSPSKSKTKAQLTKAKLEELRVKALFNPSDAAKLKAMKRGQDISFTGEARVEDDDEEDEQGILEKYEFGLKDLPEQGDDEDGEVDGGEREDDDWESESEGWKREQTEEDW